MIGLFLLTLRELRARKVVVGLFVVATLIWVAFTFALQLDIVDGTLAGARLFGQDTMSGDAVDLDEPLRDAEGAVLLDDEGQPRTQRENYPFGDTLLENLVFGAQAFVAGAAYWVGIVLALFATGGLVAALTERGVVDVVLTKPLSRSAVLAGRLLAVWAVMLALLVYLFGGVWFVISLKSGLWAPGFLLAIPVVFIMFAVMYGVVTLVGVWSGSGPLSFIVTLGVVFVSLILAIPELATQVDPMWRPLITGGYWTLPNFGGVGTRIVPQLATGGDVGSAWLLGSSVAFGAACYGGAFLLFSRKDF